MIVRVVGLKMKVSNKTSEKKKNFDRAKIARDLGHVDPTAPGTNIIFGPAHACRCEISFFLRDEDPPIQQTPSIHRFEERSANQTIGLLCVCL